MAHRFLEIATTPAVEAAQAANGSRHAYARLEGGEVTHDRLGPAEAAFVMARESLYMATVSETGWPYLQHRGGPAGFIKVLDERTLGIADYRGNRQYVSLGNLAADSRAALFLMDYPNRRRLKMFARVEVVDLAADPALAMPERGFILHVEAFDWNCPQHITPRFTEAEIATAVRPLQARLVALEAENEALKRQLVPATEVTPGQ